HALTREHERLRVRSEDKDTIVAFHWRGAPDERAAAAAVEEIGARAQQEGFALHWGRKVLEVRPPVVLDKGLGVSALLQAMPVEAPVYVGDDTTELDAFRSLRELEHSGTLGEALCVAASSDEAPADLAREADLTVDGRRVASGKASTTLPAQRATAVHLSRLWPLLLLVQVACGLDFVAPHVHETGAGYQIVLANGWRQQDSRVEANEARDGVCFYVRRT